MRQLTTTMIKHEVMKWITSEPCKPRKMNCKDYYHYYYFKYITKYKIINKITKRWCPMNAQLLTIGLLHRILPKLGWICHKWQQWPGTWCTAWELLDDWQDETEESLASAPQQPYYYYFNYYNHGITLTQSKHRLTKKTESCWKWQKKYGRPGRCLSVLTSHAGQLIWAFEAWGQALKPAGEEDHSLRSPGSICFSHQRNTNPAQVLIAKCFLASSVCVAQISAS